MKTNALQYRKGSVADLSQLTELGILSYSEFSNVLTPENWTILNGRLHDEASRKQLIEQSTVFVCCDNDKIVGMAYLVSKGNPTDIYPADWSYIRMVGVHPEYRGLGIGKEVTRMCITQARATNEKIIGLHTSEIMDAARNVYESLGFHIVKEIPPVFGVRYWLYRLDL